MTFRESLEDLKNHIGARNALLMSVAMRGFGEGMSAADVAKAFSEADCGEPALSDQEVSRAISRAREYCTGEANSNPARFAVSMKKMNEMRAGTSPEERGFVRRMIEIGKRARGCVTDRNEPARLLMESSPVKLIGIGVGNSLEVKRYQINAYVKALFPDDSNFVFATDNIRSPRDRTRIYRPSELHKWLMTNDGIYSNNVMKFQPLMLRSMEYQCPTHIGVNPYTGIGYATKKGGELSFANKNTISEYCHALIEFDAMDLNNQAYFWYGVIKSGELDVVSIVHTGNKSLHGVVRVRQMDIGDDLFGSVSETAKQQQFSREWARILRLCASDEDVTLRCDAACKDATRMTRFPGGLRDRYQNQFLVWCSKFDNQNAKIKWY